MPAVPRQGLTQRRWEVLERLDMKDYARVVQLSAEEPVRLSAAKD